MTTTYKSQPDGIPIIDKSPDALLPYPTDWAAPAPIGPWLEPGETIASFVVTVDAGLTKAAETMTPNGAATMVTVWLSGGASGTTYTVKVAIVTSLGKHDERSFRVRVGPR